MSKYSVFVPKQAVGANLVYFDLFNGSNNDVNLIDMHPIVSGEVAVVGILGVDLFVTYTTAVGTGGTAATLDGSSLTAMTISKMNQNSSALPDGITGRLTPTGGATAGAVLTWTSVFTEETSAATYNNNSWSLLNEMDIIISPNKGIRVIQGPVALVGNIGFHAVIEA